MGGISDPLFRKLEPPDDAFIYSFIFLNLGDREPGISRQQHSLSSDQLPAFGFSSCHTVKACCSSVPSSHTVATLQSVLCTVSTEAGLLFFFVFETWFLCVAVLELVL